MSKLAEDLYLYFKSHIGKSYPEGMTTFGRWLQPIIKKVEREELHLEFLTRPEQGNPAGTVHGGVLSAIIDETIGAMMYYTGEPHFKSTINLSVDYLNACRPGDVLLCRARLIKSGKTLLHATADIIREDDNRIIASGSSSLIVMVKAKS
ncbi:MAG: hypothetical protein RLZZ543_2141 [Bacteroidota bacterium]|jgi:uncharacterized protein (TIGR00369 family)